MSTEDAWYMADKLQKIIQSHDFVKDDFDSRSLKLSQSFCLLWQEKETGEVPGRQRAGKVSNGAVVAVLLDLFMLGKIEFKGLVKQWTTMKRKREILFVQVSDTSPTGTFLDKALFTAILSHHTRNPDEPKTVTEWILQGSCLTPTCGTMVLNSLVEAKILGKSSLMFWKKYPTINPEPEKTLVTEICRIALMGHIPDNYMWTLLKLLCDVDNNAFTKGSILSRLFSAEESAKAKSYFATFAHVGDELNIDAAKLESFELQDLTRHSVKSQDEEQQMSNGAEASCTVHKVNLVDKEEELNSSTSVERCESSQLLCIEHNKCDDTAK